ncbi:MAG: hypothetical protein CMB80_02055 [Flammeovirgaceae bacterium]|nr:hypothetical protein [Flammeovirgaceae bacterium]
MGDKEMDIIQEMTKDYEVVNRKKELKRLVEKWERTGLLKKLKEDGSYGYVGKKGIVARLLENQAAYLRSMQLSEATQTGNVANYNKIAFPLVRRVFGQLLANEIVSVQPMSLPSGLLFYLDFKWDRNKNGMTSGGSVYGQLDNGQPNNNAQLDGVGEQTASGGYYNMQSGYSMRQFVIDDGSTAPTYSGVTATSQLLGGATVSGYNFTLSASGSTDLADLQHMRIQRYGELNFDGSNTFRSLSALHSVSGGHYWGTFDHTMTYVTGALIQCFCSELGTIDVTWSAASVTAARLVGSARTNVSVDNGTNNLGDFESTSAIPEINLSVSSVAVTAQTRKLKATWTPELAQDLNAYHALDAEVELTTILSEVISTEIDRDILAQLLNGAAVKAAWSRSIGRYVKWVLNDNVQTITPTSSYTYQNFHGTQQDWYQTLGETIIVVSNEIHKRNLRSGANWLVTSPEISSIIEAIATFKPNAVFDPTEVQYSLGIEKIGTLTNRFTIYKDPYFPVDKILVGYKGAGFLDSGFVYAPYVPLVVTPTIFEPDDFTPRKGVMHRAATQMVRPEYYGKLVVSDLHIIGEPASVSSS